MMISVKIFMQISLSCYVISGLTPTYQYQPLNLTTASVGDVQQAIFAGHVTCRQVIQGYLDRIEAYNRNGPQIGAVVTVNPQAISEAIGLDNYYAMAKKMAGILHCAPMLVKDNIDVAGLPTSAGFLALKYSVPNTDADAVRNAKQAGAIVIGKANMSPQADKEAWGNSETGGLIRNPFNPNYTSYGSSGGNGAGGGAAFAILGFGTETGVSVNLPSSAANLVGLRPPVSIISQNGVLPNSAPQDVIGPMAKKVEDVALLLDAMTGNTHSKRYSAAHVLNENGLKGMRFSILKTFAYDEFDVPGANRYVVDPQIKDMFNKMVANLQSAGATVSNVSLDMATAMGAVMRMMSGKGYGACMVQWRDTYFGNFERFGLNAPYHSVQDVVNSGRLPEYYQQRWQDTINASSNGLCMEQMADYMTDRQSFIDNVISPLLKDADVGFWPTMPVFPAKLEEDAFKRDWGSKTAPPVNLIQAGSWSAYPTIDVPLGFSKTTQDEPYGLPIGAMFISKPENLKILLKIAYAYQKNFGEIRTPIMTPELPPKWTA